MEQPGFHRFFNRSILDKNQVSTIGETARKTATMLDR